MAQYGLTKEVIESGDLRTMMAVEPAGTENSKLFEQYRQMDDLISIKPGRRPSLVYDKEAIQRYNQLQKKLVELRPFIREGSPGMQGPCGMFSRGTCVIAGTAPNLNKEVVKLAHDNSLPVIGLGNVCYSDVDIDFWIGRQDVLGYLPKPLESQRVMAFVHGDYMNEGLWDPHHKKQSGVVAGSCVNTLGYHSVEVPFGEWIEDPSGITDGGLRSSLTVGISLAVLMGCHNIILTGVRLGGKINDFFIYEEVPHADTIHRKSRCYSDLRERFLDIYKALAHHGIRIVGAGVDSIPSRIPNLPVDYLKRALHSALAMTRRIDPKKTKVTMPPNKKRNYIKMVNRNQPHIVTPPVLLDNVDALVKAAPSVFGGEDVKKAVAEFEDAQKRPGGCTGCMKGRVGQPLYIAFEKGVQDKNQELLKAWEEVLPDHYILKAQLMRGTVMSDMIFRQDKQEEEQAWKDGQL